MKLHPAIVRLGDELRAKPMLRVGVWLIAAILLFYCIADVQSGRLSAVASEYAVTADRLSRSRALLERQDWNERVATARGTEEVLAARFWHAENPGLAQARLRTELTALMEELHVDQLRIKLGLSQPVDDVPSRRDAGELWRIQAQITGLAPRRGILRIVHAIASHPNKLVEEQLNITRPRTDTWGNTRFDMLVSAYFLMGELVGEPMGEPKDDPVGEPDDDTAATASREP
ncbi:MAG: hypothetical protein J4F45_12770 [Pseudomonadales bacterium]|nr:hypothetical protein [Pseudomonadales bacterium]